ncbi:MAG: PP2C family protein-serine/threonine phosphatase [Planctomycetota bacterium]
MIGFVLALPIPLSAWLLSVPAGLFVLAGLVPFGSAVLYGAAVQVGTTREVLIRRLRLDALRSAAAHAETSAGHQSEAKQLRRVASAERIHTEELTASLERVDAELALAELIHRSLISPGMDHDDVQVAVRHVPHAFVGGDYVRVERPRDGLFYLCIGDVAGHGVAAALVVSRMHAMVQRLIGEEAAPAEFVRRLGHAARSLLVHTSLFVTFAVFKIELGSDVLEFATAGHPPQLLRRADGTLEELHTPNLPLGLARAHELASPRTGKTMIGPDDTLMLFTDGLFEVRGDRAESGHWGEESVAALFAGIGANDVESVANGVLDAMRTYRGWRPSDDDVTVVVARIAPHPMRRTEPSGA